MQHLHNGLSTETGIYILQQYYMKVFLIILHIVYCKMY